MRPAAPIRRRRLVLPAVAAAAALGLAAVPSPASAVPPPGMAVVVCDLGGDLEAVLGDRFGGIWLDVPTQHLRVGLLDPADQPAARAVVETCDAKGAAAGRLALPPAAPDTAYVVVPTSYPALRRAQQALTDWWSGPAGSMGRPGIVDYGVRLAADGLGMSLRVTLHTDAGDADVARIEAAVASIAAQHGVPIRIDELRANYVFAPAIGEPNPLPAPKLDPPAPAPPALPSILSRSTVSRRTTLSTRKLPVRLRVTEGGPLRVTIRTTDRRRAVVARGAATPKSAGRLTVRAALTKAGRVRLRTARRTSVTITVEQAGRKAVTRRLVVR